MPKVLPSKKPRLFLDDIVFGDWLIKRQDNSFFSLLIYIYKNTPIAHFQFEKGHIKEIDFYQQLSCNKAENISLLSENAPHATLINFYLKTVSIRIYDEALFRKITLNYFHGPQSDYLDYQLPHELIFSAMLPPNMTTELLAILAKENIFSHLLDDKVWTRDFLVNRGNGHVIINAVDLDPTLTSQALTIARLNPAGYLSQNRINLGEHTQKISGTAISKHGQSIRTAFKIFLETNHISYEESPVILEGGNMLTVENPSDPTGKPITIIGENLCFLTAIHRQQREPLSSIENNAKAKIAETMRIQYRQKMNPENKTAKQNTQKPFFYRNLEVDYQKKINYIEKESSGSYVPIPLHIGDIKLAREEISKVLNISLKEMIVIPNSNFHIDMELCPGPNGTIFINSPQMIADITAAENAKSPSMMLVQLNIVAQLFQTAKGDILQAIKNKLIKKGFTVVEVPGTVYTASLIQQAGEDEEDQDQYQLFATMINGLMGRGKNGYFHIAAACPCKALADKFKEILQENGVNNVYFIGDEKEVEVLLKQEGALRCLSVPRNPLFGLFNQAGSTSSKLNLAARDSLSTLKKDIIKLIPDSDDSDSNNEGILRNTQPTLRIYHDNSDDDGEIQRKIKPTLKVYHDNSDDHDDEEENDNRYSSPRSP